MRRNISLHVRFASKTALPQQFVCFGRPRSYAFSHGRVGDLLPAKRLAERKVWYSDQSNSRYYKLAQLYNDPRRCYHTMAHLAYMLDLLEVYEKREKTDFDRHHLILAVFAHDLVNEGTADDVARSAQKSTSFRSTQPVENG